MTSVDELKIRAQQLRKAKNFADALPLYRELWENHRGACNKWDGWGYAYCLSKQKLYSQALAICREVYRLDPDFAVNNNTYAWAIYHTEISNDTVQDESRFTKAAYAIVKLCRPDDLYSPFVRTVLAAAKHFERKGDSRLVIQWLTRIDDKFLSDDTFTITDPTGKRRELASDREQYYATLSKALLEIEDYQACIDLCQKALVEVRTLHYDNDVWFKWRIAVALHGLGRTTEAIAMAEDLLKKRREWFIQHKLAEMLADIGQKERALKYAAEAALGFGDLDKKLKLFQFMADLLAQMDRPDDAKDHLALVYRIRKEQGWKVKEELYRQLQAFSVAETDIPTSKNLAKRLRARWQAIKFEGKTHYTGKITKLLPSGKAGFVAVADGGSYYFNANAFAGPKKLLKPGTVVTFYLEDGFDFKKNRPSKNAVYLTPVS